MTRQPIIVSSLTMEPMTRARPPPSRIRPHKWLSPSSVELYEAHKVELEMFLSKNAEERIRNHALSQAHEHLEVMGFLLGNVYVEGETTYVLVKDVVTTDLDASSVSVRFAQEGWEQLFCSLDEIEFDYVIVGWYHSHPGHGCFLSDTDLETQRRIFDRPWHNALVIDPLQREIANFSIHDGKVKERPFAIYWEEYQNPYFGESVHKRRRSNPDGMPLAQ